MTWPLATRLRWNQSTRVGRESWAVGCFGVRRRGKAPDVPNDEKAAQDEQAESDVEPDPHVAGARQGKHGAGDGSYVGRSGSDDDFDAGESGAEARTQRSGDAQ